MALAAVAEGQRVSHGGDVERVACQAGIAAESLLDFSANVNPMGLPPRAAARLAREASNPRLWSQYPDPEAPELRRLLSQRLNVEAGCIVIGAGADALIHGAVRALEPRRCVIPVPAFLEYERACQAYGCVVHAIPLAMGAGLGCISHPTRPGVDTGPEGTPDAARISACATGRGDLVILNNPHNPTGAGAGRAEMREWIAAARSAGASVLADEAFIDYDPEAAITSEAAAQTGVISVRSLTKFFGCPGLRVGYAVAAPETARRLAAQLPAWPVTTLALNALAEALQDGQYARETLERNERARAQLAGELSRVGCQVFPSAANFLFLRLPDGLVAADVRERLIRERAILVRACDSFAGIERGRYLRVAVRLESDNARLVQALAGVCGGGRE